MLAMAPLVDGRVRLPDAVRAALAIRPGDPMYVSVLDGAIVLSRVLAPAAWTAPLRALPARVLPLAPPLTRRRVRV